MVNEYKVPDDSISFYADGTVNVISTFYNKDHSPASLLKYEVIDGVYKVTTFNERQQIYDFSVPTEFEKLPEDIQKIFDAKTKEAVNQLIASGELTDFVMGSIQTD